MSIINKLKALGLHRMDLLCAFFAYELNESSLQRAPALLMGFRSVAKSPLLRARQTELDNLRRACVGLSTIVALRAAAVRYNDASRTAGHQRHFHIDERTLAIRPLFDLASMQLREALEALRVPPTPKPHGMAWAQTDKPMWISVQFAGESRRYEIDSPQTPASRPIQHETGNNRRAGIQVAWDALLAEAKAMDEIDEQLKLARRGNWYKRLHEVALLTVDDAGRFDPRSQIDLLGLTHMIGLPGAGKTTLLMCLLRYLGVRDKRVAVFFPSIEVSRQYLETLRTYNVKAGLLVGQSRETRLRHAHKLGETLATDDPLHGFGLVSETTSLFEGVCPLPSLTSAPSEAFAVADHFCTKILQTDDESGHNNRLEARLCPIWSICGFPRAARELPQASIWLGHVLSADTGVPRHVSGLDERNFELIARSFDLVIFDEADRAQQDLDRVGIAELTLSGHDNSFHRQIQRGTLQPIASGRNAVLHGVDYAQLAIDIAEFEKLNVALIHAVLRLSEPMRRDFDGLLLSPLRIIGDWLSPKQLSQLSADIQPGDPQARSKDALCVLWESAAIQAFQLRGSRLRSVQPSDEDLSRLTQAFSLSIEEAATLKSKLAQLMSDWLAESSLKELSEITREISDLLRDVRRVTKDADALQLIGLLLPVTFTILSYRRLSPRLTDMTEQGLMDPVHVDQLASKALLVASPDNILGSLSGVRFFSTATAPDATPNANDVQLQYVVFAGTPRTMMYRLHEWIQREDGTREGPAVLLTSATSYLPESPASHIPVTPKYVLRQRRPSPSTQMSHYEFRPIRERDEPDAGYLRFSGERSESARMMNLERMVFALLDGGPTESLLARDCAAFDVRHQIARKAALIVNSYAQARRLKQYIDQQLPAWRDRVVAVVDDLPVAASPAGYVTSSRVETLGDDEKCQILIFPPGALGRGINVVFSRGARERDAAIGTLYFLTRPHPAPNDLGLPVSMAARATLDFDLAEDESTSLDEIADRLQAARSAAYGQIGRLLRRPLYARALGPLFEPFTANMAVNLLQTIGRGMRNGCPVQCFFVDRAWAEKSARGEADTATSSMLVQLRLILERGVHSSDPRTAALYTALYSPFLEPLAQTKGLLTGPDLAGKPQDDVWKDNPLWVADAPIEVEAS